MRVLLLAFCAATAARGAEPVFDAPEPAPQVYSPLIWRSGGKDVHGIWSTDAAVRKLQLKLEDQQAQVDYLTDKATKQCIQVTDADTRAAVGSAPSLWIVGSAALVVGFLGGLVAAHHF